MQYIDTHLHLSKHDYEDINVIIDRAKEKACFPFIVSCCSREDIIEGIELLEKYPDIYFSFGFHPSEVESITDEDLKWLEDLVKQNKRIVAIGEIGLDYHYGKDNVKEQKALFKKQIELAKRCSLPIIIHTRDATDDTIKILKETRTKGVIHCFSGSKETANIYIKMGFKLGIGGVLTFTNSHLKDVIKEINIENLVLETDSPYLAPEPVRGSKNEPSNIVYIAKKLATIKQISEEEVAKITTKNAIEMFDLSDK